MILTGCPRSRGFIGRSGYVLRRSCSAWCALEAEQADASIVFSGHWKQSPEKTPEGVAFLFSLVLRRDERCIGRRRRDDSRQAPAFNDRRVDGNCQRLAGLANGPDFDGWFL